MSWGNLRTAVDDRNFLSVALILQETKDLDAHRNEFSGYTPLEYAVREQMRDVVTLLLDIGASVKTTSLDNATPLHYAACHYGRYDPEIIHMLIEAGADIDAAEKDGTTPLHLAARWGVLEPVQILVEAGASLTKMTISRRNPLHEAIDYKQQTVIDYLTQVSTWRVSNNVVSK